MRTETPFLEKETAPLGESFARNRKGETAKFLPGSKSKPFDKLRTKALSEIKGEK